MTRVARYALVAAGTVCVILGAVALIVPVVPTTPFLLVAAACYAKGSRRFYDWLLRNRLFGPFIRNYREKGGITRRQKIVALAAFWPAVLVSAVFAPVSAWTRGILIAAAIAGTAYFLWMKTVEDE